MSKRIIGNGKGRDMIAVSGAWLLLEIMRTTLMAVQGDVKNAPGAHDQAEHGMWALGIPHTPEVPHPVPMVHWEGQQVPQFNNQAEESRWLSTYRYNGIELGNVAPSLRTPLIQTYVKMTTDFPALSQTAFVRTASGDAMPAVLKSLTGDNFTGCYGYTYNQGSDSYSYLNEKYFADGSIVKEFDNCSSVNWHPACQPGAEAQMILAHEMGHDLYYQMSPQKKKQWLSMYGSLNGVPPMNFVQQLSGYAMVSPEEGFAEAISAAEYGDSKYMANPLVVTAVGMAKGKI